MSYEQRDNSGVLFKNGYKKPGDKQPDYKGNGMINGALVDIAAWTKEGQKGTFLSLSFQPPRQPQQEGMGEYQGEQPQRQVAPPSVSRPRAPLPQQRPPEVAGDDESLPF